ncbi:MAG: serine/threonine protein kinase [Myxococcales bacterium]|nr:serine/threonine protein kinase [Myxococcales bacterium]
MPEATSSPVEQSDPVAPLAAFGRYELLELIAKGGMAEVFMARQAGAAGTEKLLCIKRILPHLSKDSEFLRLFISEAKIALPLNHGNITQVYDFGELDGVYYLAMEYIRGPNLAKVIERCAESSPIGVPAALYIGSEICKGLSYAHSYTDSGGKLRVVVHRDVSPHNVLISYTGQVKLADFGIALAASKARERESVVRGKPCYVSPEQADGKATDPRSDIFSLGAVLYEMLTGKRCFEGETESETLSRVREAKADAPSKHNSQVTPELDAVVLKALARDPAARYQRAGDMQVALTQALVRGWPDYTAEQLAAKMRELFSWEIEQLEGGENGARDRLLMQLSRAGVEVQDPSASTGELLDMATVAIDTAGATPDHDPGRKRNVVPWAIAGSLLAVVIAFVALFLLDKGKQDGGNDSGGVVAHKLPPPPKAAPTEHLAPASLQQHPGEGSALGTSEGNGEGSGEGSAASAKKGSGAAPSKTRKRPRMRAAPPKVGYLNCNSWPWSVVYLDGKRLPGNTPIYRVKVTAGKHTIKFVNPELSLSKEVKVTVAPDRVRTVAISLQ